MICSEYELVFLSHHHHLVSLVPPNGLRYQRVGGLGGGLRCGKNSKPENYSKVGQTPRRLVHVLLDHMAGRKKQQTRKCNWGGGTKPSWQDNPAKEPADIMTRLRARRHNQKRHCQRNQAGDPDCQKARKKPSGRPTGYEEKTSRLKNAIEVDTAERTMAGKPRLQAKAKNPHLTSDTVFKRKEKHDGLTRVYTARCINPLYGVLYGNLAV